MAKIRVSDIDNVGLVNDIEPKVISIQIGVEDKEGDKFKSDLADSEYELLIWMLKDKENVKAMFTSMRRRKAQLGKSRKELV